jgi:very-short-patch-repair endonuclease
VAFAAAALPTPVLQASFCAAGRWHPERVDFWWPQFRTVAEADGLAKYDADSARERRDLLRRAFVREQRIADLGLEVIRFGWEDVVPAADALVGRLRAAFTRGLRRHGEPPTWRTVQPPEAASH